MCCYRPVDAHELRHADRGDLEWLRGVAAAIGVGGNRPPDACLIAWSYIKVELDHAAAAEVRYLQHAVEGAADLLFTKVSVNV
jgi:hypothetical protein